MSPRELQTDRARGKPAPYSLAGKALSRVVHAVAACPAAPHREQTCARLWVHPSLPSPSSTPRHLPRLNCRQISAPPSAWRRRGPVCRGSLRGKWPRRSVRRPEAPAGGGGFSEAKMSCSSNSHGAGSSMGAESGGVLGTRPAGGASGR